MTFKCFNCRNEVTLIDDYKHIGYCKVCKDTAYDVWGTDKATYDEQTHYLKKYKLGIYKYQN